jgi:ribose transport system ATP-binding protein
VRENVTLPTIRRYFARGRLHLRRERTHVAEVLRRFKVLPSSPGRPLGTLSGGNQQKALLAKWFELEPRVLLLHEPTQGVDVGAKQAIFQLVSDVAARGVAVVLASAEYEDLSRLCHRVIVFRNGRAAAELQGALLTEDRIVEQCMLSQAAAR